MKILYEDEEKFHPDEIVSMPGYKVIRVSERKNGSLDSLGV